MLESNQRKGLILLARTTDNFIGEQIRFVLPKDEKDAFVKKCEERETTISIQLRKFIKEFISDTDNK